MESRFKIDLNDYVSAYGYYYALYRRQVTYGVFGVRHEWEKLQTFKSKDEARAFYEKLKDLPEYLD